MLHNLKSLSTLWVEIAMHFSVNQLSIQTFQRRLTVNRWKVSSQITTSIQTKLDIQFLSIDLPSLGKDVDRSLSVGKLIITSPFKKKHGTELPVFLYELFIQLYEKDGSLRSLDDYTILRNIRQLLFIFYKYEIDLSTDVDKKNSMEEFVVRDASVKTSFTQDMFDSLKVIVSELLPDDPFDIRPHHSSGATENRIDNAEKRQVTRYIPSLMSVYPLSYFLYDRTHVSERNITIASIAEPSSRVTLVPKDSRGPRVICIEPHERMYIQKGLMQKIYDHIENDSPYKGYLNFTDQTINQRLAYLGSLDGSYATLDLKDASDLVSWELVKNIVPEDWAVALGATRSPTALVNGRVITLNKYAPMGSALCFPIEAIVFFAIVRSVAPQCWIYGDDIIIPRGYHEAVIIALESYGLRVNVDKSLYKGFFRESCGADYYAGWNITPLRLKGFDLDNFVSFCNNVTKKYDNELASRLIRIFEEYSNTIVFRAKLSGINNPRSFVFYTDNTSPSYVFFKRRYNVAYQKYEIRLLSKVQRLSSKVERLTERDRIKDWMDHSCGTSSPRYDAAIKKTLDGLIDLKSLNVMPVPVMERHFTMATNKCRYVWVGDTEY